jgi:hypothetical protein
MADSIRRGEAPFASHLLYPQVLGEDNELERHLGINCGYEWGRAAALIAFYTDRGWSDGMMQALDHWIAADKPYEFRALSKEPKLPPPTLCCIEEPYK